jgi:hypothetical protein
MHHDALEFPDGQLVLLHTPFVKASTRRCCNCPPFGMPSRRWRNNDALILLPKMGRLRRALFCAWVGGCIARCAHHREGFA